MRKIIAVAFLFSLLSADEKTATAVAQRFGIDHFNIRPTQNNRGGSYVYVKGDKAGQNAVYRVLVFLPGAALKDEAGDVRGRVSAAFEVNAGVLADYFRRMPEKNLPATTFIYGNPPVTYYRLSTAEQFAWRLLSDISKYAEAHAQIR